LGSSILAAGLSGGAMDQLGISAQDTGFNTRVMKTAVQTGVSSSLAMVTEGQDC